MPSWRARPWIVAPSRRSWPIAQRIARVLSRPRGAQTSGFCSAKVVTAQTRSRQIQRRLRHRIRIRTYDYSTGVSTVQKIRGAKAISHREPEGIQVAGDGTVELMIASHYKEKYTCVNVYGVK